MLATATPLTISDAAAAVRRTVCCTAAGTIGANRKLRATLT